jgi:hypothetical protein
MLQEDSTAEDTVDMTPVGKFRLEAAVVAHLTSDFRLL